jgi:hypothetical protein
MATRCAGAQHRVRHRSAYPSPQSATTAGWEIIGIHTLALLLVMGAVALAVYQTAGLGLLRRAWINLDLLWAGALVAAGGATLLLPTPA